MGVDLQTAVCVLTMEAMWNRMLCGLGMQQFTNSLHPWCFAV